jgi:4-amino-4-deoxy-L-arabinose transferase-like glycosyltransferase
MSRRLILFALIAALALTVSFWSFTAVQAVAFVRVAGYWMVFAAFALFVWVAWRSLRKDFAELRAWRTWALPVAATLLVAGFLHLHEPHAYKIVADELLLQLTAKEMHLHRGASVVLRGYEYAGTFVPLASMVDKRPLFFPFLLSLVHDLTGFRPGNVFVLNAVLATVLMLLVLLVGRRIAGWSGGIAAVLLLASVPLLAQNACGAGFEILNLVMIVATLWLGMRAAEAPEDADRLSAFVLCGVLLAQVRYESVLFLVPVAATVIYIWWRRRTISLPVGLLAAPLFLIMCPLHYNVFKLSQAAWQLDDVAGAKQPFGLGYFYENVGHAMNFFLSRDGLQPNSMLVGVAGTLAVGFFILLFYRRHRSIFAERPGVAVFTVFLLGLLLHAFFMLCYFWGKWDDPIIHRLSLPTHLLLVFSIVLVWPEFVSVRRRWAVLNGITLLFIVGWTMPTNAMHRYTQGNFAARATNWIDDYIRSLGSRSALAIDQNSGLLWFVRDKSSVAPPAIADRPEALILHFRNHSFAEFLVVQRVTPNVQTGERLIREQDDFGDALKLELIEERAFAPLYLVRLSRIVGIDEAKLKAWAKARKEHPAAPGNNMPALTPAENEHLLLWLRQLP